MIQYFDSFDYSDELKQLTNACFTTDWYMRIRYIIILKFNLNKGGSFEEQYNNSLHLHVAEENRMK